MVESSKLFRPLRIGESQLAHRVIMAPMTRYRADDDNVQLDFVKDYYAQRASTPGTMIVTEATYISSKASGNHSTPGIWSETQISAFKEITDAVHKKGSYIYCQLWALGRAADPELLKTKGHKFGSSSAVPMDDKSPTPEQLTEGEIWDLVHDFAQAAQNAMQAGFDGVEIHGANGYLVDQFLQDTCNQRTDSWGGSVENRARFAIEVAKAVAKAVGPNHVGIRLSPFSPFQGMKMQDPVPQYSYLLRALKELNLAYLHLVEPRVSGIFDIETEETNDSLIELWDNASPIILAGGFKPESVRKVVDEKYKDKDIAIAFGRYFIANPDLPFRLKSGVAVQQYDRTRFYNPREKSGYIDYPFSGEFGALQVSNSV